jgi:hypothetical protein
MPKPDGSQRRAYTGRGGQMAVLAELLERECNAAVPEVDVGTDVFAFRDDREDVARIQVKTAHGTPYTEGYSAQFRVPIQQLNRPDRPRLFYALVARLGDRYADFLIISRVTLQEYWTGDKNFATWDKQNNEAVLTVQFRAQVICGEVDLTRHRNDWTSLPPFVEPMAVAEEGLVTEKAVAEQLTAPDEQGTSGSAPGAGAEPPPQT